VEAEALSGLPVTGFTYPHGDRNAETIDMVRQAGYRWACSTCEAVIGPLCANLHDLPRLAVGDWRANTLLVRLGALSACPRRRPIEFSNFLLKIVGVIFFF
jgi:hypothetical protein